MNIIDLVCYFDFLHYINLIQGPSMKFHVYAVLIQDIKELIALSNVNVYRTLREGNKCADYMAS